MTKPIRHPDQWKDHQTGFTLCPFCGAMHDAATGATDVDPPEDGDCSVCIECATAAIFDSSLPEGKRRPTHAEQRRLDRDPAVQHIIASIKTVLTNNPRKGQL